MTARHKASHTDTPTHTDTHGHTEQADGERMEPKQIREGYLVKKVRKGEPTLDPCSRTKGDFVMDKGLSNVGSVGLCWRQELTRVLMSTFCSHPKDVSV